MLLQMAHRKIGQQLGYLSRIGVRKTDQPLIRTGIDY